MPSRYTTNYADQVQKTNQMRTKKSRSSIPGIFILMITMIALAVYAQLALMQKSNADIRSRAYTQTATGVRMESEEMTRSGSVTLDSSGTFITFGP